MKRIDITNYPAVLLNIWKIAGKIRRRLWRFISLFLLGPCGGSVPRSSIHTMQEASWKDCLTKHLETSICLSGARCVDYVFPKHFPECFRRQKAFDRQYVYLLTDVIIAPNSGLAWLPEGHILQESVGSLHRLMGWDACICEPLLPAVRLETQNPVVVMPSTGYYHWLFENLPGVLAALHYFEDAQLLLPRNPPGYLVEAANWILKNHGKAESYYVCDRPVRCSRIVLPQVKEFSGFVHPDIRTNLRSEFLSPGNSDLCVNSKRWIDVYVSRKKTPKRRLGNEEELERMLQGFGFTVVYAEDLSFREQVELFSRARWMVAPHGAGLGNMVWATNGIGVLEVFPHGNFNDCFARLAVSQGFKYDYVTCSPDPVSSGRIPVDRVEQMLCSALERAEGNP